MAINEEFIAEYARVIGNAHAAVNKGFGSETIPGSAIFSLNQLKYLAETKQPAFGIIQIGATPGFNVTIDPDDNDFLKISSGQITYFNNQIKVPAQRLSIVKYFANTYLTTDVYGMRIGFPIAEAQKIVSSIYASVLSENFTANNRVIYIQNVQRIIELGFPITAYLGLNTYVVFEKPTDDKTGLVIDPAIIVNKSFDKGTSINFIYEPKVKALFGLPVAVSSHDPDEFLYYPPLPSDWLHVADVLIKNPISPEVDLFGLNPAISRKAIDYPPATVDPPLFSSLDSQQILKFTNVALTELQANSDKASVVEAINALEFYTSALQESAGKTFRQFWATRPFNKSTYFNKGISYEGLEKFEFSDNFADAYYDLKQQDLNRTYAMFRGDLYGNPSIIYGAPPADVITTSYNNFKGIKSTIANGTYFYGVSAVITTGETRETPARFESVISNPGFNNYINEIQWQPVANAQFYHIYRKSTQSGELFEYRLTAKNTIKGAGPLSNSDATVTANDNANLNTTGIAFKISPTGATELHFGGILFKLRVSDKTLTNLAGYVSVKLYTNDGNNKPGTHIVEAVFENVTFEEIARNTDGVLTDLEKDIILKTNYKFLQTSSYWIVLTLSEAPSVGNVQIRVSNLTATSKFATYSSPNWSYINNVTAYFKLLGFLDNGLQGIRAASQGLYLTKKITKEPRRLRVFVPEVESSATFEVTTGAGTNPETKITKNEMIVTITAQNGSNDPVTLPSVTIPQYTALGTEFLVGTTNQIFDRVLDVQVFPGINLNYVASNSIQWSKYDLFVVENVP